LLCVVDPLFHSLQLLQRPNSSPGWRRLRRRVSISLVCAYLQGSWGKKMRGGSRALGPLVASWLCMCIILPATIGIVLCVLTWVFVICQFPFTTEVPITVYIIKSEISIPHRALQKFISVLYHAM
jgi:hypothetical protein